MKQEKRKHKVLLSLIQETETDIYFLSEYTHNQSAIDPSTYQYTDLCRSFEINMDPHRNRKFDILLK